MDTSNQRLNSIGLTHPITSAVAQIKTHSNNNSSSQQDLPSRKKFSGMPRGNDASIYSRPKQNLDEFEYWQSSERFTDGSVGYPQYTVFKGADDFVYKVFLKGLNKSTVKETVVSVLKGFGKITYLRMPYSTRMNRNLGYCVAIFDSSSVGRQLVEQVRSLEIDGAKVMLSQFKKIQKNYYSPGGMVKLQHTRSDRSSSVKAAGRKAPVSNWSLSSGVASIHRSKRDLEISLHCRKPTQSDYHSTIISKPRDFAHSSSNLLLRVRWVPLKPSISNC